VARILVCGLCPLPFENTRKTYGPGIRTWQFARPLARRGHQVRILAMRIGDAYGGDLPAPTETREGIEIQRVSDGELLTGEVVARTVGEWRPEAVVGATVYGSHALARVAPQAPFWADQFGHVMAEAQAKAALEKANWPLAYFWRLLQPILIRADRISAVSERHRCAVIGELGAAGRLGAETVGYEFTAVIPCAAESPADPARAPVVRGVKTPPDAFIVLWSGSFNVWSDVSTVYRALETAMRAEPSLYFVSTGGGIEGHDDLTYAHFQSLVEGSPFRERFLLEGWVPHDLVPSYTAEASVGVLAERSMYEGMMGSKNRIVHWLAAGLPVIYNRVGDLGDMLAEKELGRTFPVGDAAALAAQILAAAADPAGQRRTAERARRFAQSQLTYEATTRELVAWCERPTVAPDRGVAASLTSPADHGTALQKIAEQVPALRGTAPARLLSKLRGKWSGR
jgi:glycosyltransferase involved in cell wall biosynthesis